MWDATNQASFEIRPATEDDVPVLLSLIKELAAYEHLSHEVVATEDDIERSLFAAHPIAEAVIGEYETDPIGFALYFHSFSTFLGRPGIYLEDLYVKPEHRGRGFGRRMLAYLARLAKARHCGRLEWSVLDWNEPAIKAYQRVRAVPLGDWTVYRLAGEALDKLADEK